MIWTLFVLLASGVWYPIPTNEHYEACLDMGHTVIQEKGAVGFFCERMDREKAEFYERLYLLSSVEGAGR